MSLFDTLHTNSKYGVLIVSCALIGGMGFVFTYAIFNLYGQVFGFVCAIVFIAIIIGIVNAFAFEGYKEYTFEEAILHNTPNSAISVCEVRVKDPIHGKIWFQERGKLIVTNLGTMFFYGWPFIKGHKLFRINTLDAQDASGILVDIESEVPPDVNPDGLWLDTEKAIKLSGGKTLDYQEYKNKVTAYEMIQRQGQINRANLGGDIPTLKKTGVTTISLDDLTAKDV